MPEQKWAFVPMEPTPEMIAAAVGAVLPAPHPNDFELARSAARLILMDPRTPPGNTIEGIAAAMATIIPAHRALLNAAPPPPAVSGQPTLLGRAAEALAAYMHAVRIDDSSDRASVMAAIRAADTLAKSVYAELYAAIGVRGTEGGQQ